MVDSSAEGMYCIVTGGSSGIGKEIARGLMERVQGSHVVITSRDSDKCQQVKRELEESAPSSSCSCMTLDLADLTSVRAFASDIQKELSRKKKRISLLVNNAGIWTRGGKGSLGDETFSTNYLGPFLLTNLLIPHMSERGARIVNVSSRAHFMGSVLFQPDGSLTEVHQSFANWASLGFISYARSKLANVLFTAELNRRLRDKGIVSIATSPGPVNTNLFHGLGSFQTIIKPLANHLFRSPQEGAASSLYAALSPDFDPPRFFASEKGAVFVHDDRVSEPSEMSRDKGLAEKLWMYSERLTTLD
jgi:NAD(P)-dependent dehydrogenase (short-subunit alcohol dehydrogenase family)